MKISYQQLDLKHKATSMSPIRLLIVDDRAPAREGLRALIICNWRTFLRMRIVRQLW